METLFGLFVTYLISIAAGLSTDAIKKKLGEILKKEPTALQGFQDPASLRKQLRIAGALFVCPFCPAP